MVIQKPPSLVPQCMQLFLATFDQKLRPRSHPMPLSYMQKYNQNNTYTDIYCQFIRSNMVDDPVVALCTVHCTFFLLYVVSK